MAIDWTKPVEDAEGNVIVGRMVGADGAPLGDGFGCVYVQRKDGGIVDVEIGDLANTPAVAWEQWRVYFHGRIGASFCFGSLQEAITKVDGHPRRICVRHELRREGAKDIESRHVWSFDDDD